MENHHKDHIKIDGKIVAELLDQDEFSSNLGEVAAISDREICVLRRDWHELTHFRLEYIDVRDCHAIEYQQELSYVRIIAGAACFIAALFFVYVFVSGRVDISAESAPLIIAVVGLVAIGIRFVTSTHRHIIRFEMPDETLTWSSPAIDFEYKAEAAHAVREFARKRGVFRDSAS